jgi:hypothetical protein
VWPNLGVAEFRMGMERSVMGLGKFRMGISKSVTGVAKLDWVWLSLGWLWQN